MSLSAPDLLSVKLFPYFMSPCPFQLLLPSPASGAMLKFEESFPRQAVKDAAAASFVSFFVIGSVEQGYLQNSSLSQPVTPMCMRE